MKHVLPPPFFIRLLAVGILVVGLTDSTFGQVDPPPAGPVSDLATTAEMSAQHDMIQQDIADVDTNLGAQIQEVKELVEALGSNDPGFHDPCNSGGTEVGDRWIVSRSGRTVCDKDTNTTWEQQPTVLKRTWDDSVAYCQNLGLGGGWALPSIDILVSLVDTNNTDPALPTDHPFTNVQTDSNFGYWSATTPPDAAGNRVGVSFFNGDQFSEPNFFSNWTWCAR